MPDRSKDQNGAILPLIAVCLVVFIGITALAVDIGHLLVVRNELQNAADAGALAGAQALYEDPDGPSLPLLPGEQVNTGANQVAYNTATLNRSEKAPVEVNQPMLNTVDVQRGHWSMSTRTFTQSDETATFNLFGISEEDLDRMDGSFEYPPGSVNYPVLVNAVRVVSRREDTPAASFFAGIFGFQDFGLNTDAIAYVGFAGTGIEVSGAPIVICEQSILDADGNPTCNIGRMLNSGGDSSTNNTAGWSDFTQDPSSCSATNAADMMQIVGTGESCGEATHEIGGGTLSTTGGTQASVYNMLYSCWEGKTGRTKPWTMTLPIVDCSGSSNIGNCPRLVGAMAFKLLWMTDPTGMPDSTQTPTQMEPDWDFYNPPDPLNDRCGVFKSQIGQPLADAMTYFASTSDQYHPDGLAGFSDPDRWQTFGTIYDEGMARWDCFVDHFEMVNTDGSYAPMALKSIYFAPDCEEVHPPTGGTGGPNFGVLAQRPVLVQ